MAELTGWLLNHVVISATFSALFRNENQSEVTQDEAKSPFVRVFILPVLVQLRPDVIFIENVIMNVLGYGVKHFREPERQKAPFKREQKPAR